MATRGLISSLFVGIWIAFLLADCSSLPRKSFTREQQDVAGIPGIADARTWADDPSGLSRTSLFSYGQHKPASIDVLALSGGGAEGAFGAGLLVLLCHKFRCLFRAAQHGQRESVVARAATNLRRIVAIEFGTWRSGRNGGSSGLVTFAYGNLRAQRGGTIS